MKFNIKLNGWMKKDINQIKKIIILILGITILLIGVIFLITPGPGIFIILLGMIILAAEFLWARKILKKMKSNLNASLSKFK